MTEQNKKPTASPEPSSMTDADTPSDYNHTDKLTATEYGGPKGREPTRYGDWEKNGRCIDF